MKYYIMKIVCCLMYGFCLFFGQNLFSQPTQVLQIELNKTATLNNINFISNATNTNYVFESDFTTATNEMIRLHRISNFDVYELVVKLESNTNSNIEFGISQFNSNLNEYKIVISSNNQCFLSSTNPIYNSVAMTYNSNSVFRFYKCQNELKVFMDNVLLQSFVLGTGINRYESYIKPTIAQGIDFTVMHKIGGQCLPFDPLARFCVLNSEIPTTLSAVQNKVLRFYYMEKYAIVNGTNDQIQWFIYDSAYNLVLSGLLPNVFGSNYQTVDLASISSIDDHLLVVKGANKNTDYFLKLKGVTP